MRKDIMNEKSKRLKNYILSCADEADKQREIQLAELKRKQDKCKHERVPSYTQDWNHIGNGWYSYTCPDCRKKFCDHFID
jgi:hypothetical protein